MVESKKPVRSYRDLFAWQSAGALAKETYDAAAAFPRSEIYALSMQVKRSAVSIASNIAEGYGRGTRNDYVRFLQIARGSAYELQTQLILAQNLGFLSETRADAILKRADECAALLHGLMESLNRTECRQRRTSK